MADSIFCFRHIHLREHKGIKKKREELGTERYLQVVVLIQENGSNENFPTYREKKDTKTWQKEKMWPLASDYWRRPG